MPRLRRHWENGETEFLGGFNNIHKGRPGWIVSFGNGCAKRFFALVAGTFAAYVWPVDEVHWSRYDGSESTNPLYCGDNPKQYKQLKKDGAIWLDGQETKT